MSRYTLFAVIAALCLATTHATVTTASLTSATFGTTPPGVVFQGATGAADVATWGTYNKAIFGPGTANTTVYAYGLTGTTTITAIASRSLNATLLSNGTAATAATDAKIADVVSGTVSYASPKTAVGLGSIAFAYVAADTATVPCNQLYVAVYNGGTAGAITTTKITSNTCAYCTSSVSGAGFAITVNNVFYENATYYVSYATAQYTATAAASSTACTATAAAAPAGTVGTDTDTVTITATLQGVSAGTTATLKWTTAPNWFSQAASASPTIGYTAIGSGMCGPSNYTNSTTFYCAYGSGATANVFSYVPITVASGVAGSAATIATSTVYASSTSAQTSKTYTLAGFVHSIYQQGILLNLLSTAYAASTSTASGTTNTLQLYNLTSGATSTTGAADGGIAITGYSNTYSGGAYAGDGFTYSQGFGLVTAYLSDASTTNYQIAGFFANGTANGSAPTSFSTGGAYSSQFADANGALWAGGYSVDTTLQTGNLGKLVGQLYYSAGNVLASFFALLSVMIAALLAF